MFEAPPQLLWIVGVSVLPLAGIAVAVVLDAWWAHRRKFRP